MTQKDFFNTRSAFETGSGEAAIYRLSALAEGVERLPFSIKVLLENVLRNCDGAIVTEEDVRTLANYNAPSPAQAEIPFKLARVLMQDFSGVPGVVDLAAMRTAAQRLGGDPKKINPLIPVDLVIDHSAQVDYFGTPDALRLNSEVEFERNQERYEFLRWGQQAFSNFRVVPPATGIIHQVNLEFLAKVVMVKDGVAFPDALVGTDSHTTTINSLGIVGWGVGGIEAEAVMLGQPLYILTPKVVGVKLTGRLREGVTATDLALTVTQILRRHGVVDKFVEFYGAGLGRIALTDRATIANMAPEYGATMGYFPIDAETLDYLRRTGHADADVMLVERYAKAQGLFRTDETPDPEYTETLELNLADVVPSLAGPKRPQDRVPLTEMKRSFESALVAPVKDCGFGLAASDVGRKVVVRDGEIAGRRDGETAGWRDGGTEGQRDKGTEGNQQSATPALHAARQRGASVSNQQSEISHGAVVIAAITSCTNTSNPSVLMAAGLVAKKAVERGLKPPAYVKTSLAPGSRVVTEYLTEAGLLPYLEQIGFGVVAYGCTTCLGSSGPLPLPVSNAITEGNLVAAAVLSGNRNFEGRVNPFVKANYLASPPLVVAYALAGTVDIDLAREPIGTDQNGQPVMLTDIWPTQQEVSEAVANSIKPEMFQRSYANVFDGNPQWNAIPVAGGELYPWRDASTYIQEPPFFKETTLEVKPIQPITGARVLAIFGDSVTTDHISPAGNIAENSPAGRYLISLGVKQQDFNQYGARRGNDRVMTRGTFANIRIKNLMLPGVEGGVTAHQPDGERLSIFEAALKYQEAGVPSMVLAGKEYGTGSSRDWAAKGPYLMGVHAVIAESFERIHRSNLVGMGILPLQFKDGQNIEVLGLTGQEAIDIVGLSDDLKPRQDVTVQAKRADGSIVEFKAAVRIDTPIEVEYYRNGGILQTVLRKLVKEA